MAHPGRIVFAHPPGKEGWRFLCIVYHPRSGVFSLRYARQAGLEGRVEGSRLEVLQHLENHLGGTGTAVDRAADILRNYGRRDLEAE